MVPLCFYFLYNVFESSIAYGMPCDNLSIEHNAEGAKRTRTVLSFLVIFKADNIRPYAEFLLSGFAYFIDIFY